MSRWGNDPTPPDDVGLEDELPDGQWELDPNDPTHPDHDLSEAHGYSNWDPAPPTFLARQGVVVLLGILIIIGLLVPIFYYVF